MLGNKQPIVFFSGFEYLWQIYFLKFCMTNRNYAKEIASLAEFLNWSLILFEWWDCGTLVLIFTSWNSFWEEEEKRTFKSTISSSRRLFICFARGESYSEIWPKSLLLEAAWISQSRHSSSCFHLFISNQLYFYKELA
jgi:hypothetical protein